MLTCCYDIDHLKSRSHDVSSRVRLAFVMAVLRALKCRMEVPDDLIECLERRTRDKNVGSISSLFEQYLVIVHKTTITPPQTVLAIYPNRIQFLAKANLRENCLPMNSLNHGNSIFLFCIGPLPSSFA